LKETLLVTGLPEKLMPAIVRVTTALQMAEAPPDKARTRGFVRFGVGAKRDAGIKAFETEESLCQRTFSPKPPKPRLHSIVIAFQPAWGKL
jgi:hypothetical protein